MQGDSTPYSTVRVCPCGARFAGLDRRQADRLLAEHERRAGCGTRATDALRVAAWRAARGAAR